MNESFKLNKKQQVTPENAIGVMQTLSGMPTGVSIEESDSRKRVTGNVDGYEIAITINLDGDFEFEINGQEVIRPELFQSYGKKIFSKADEIYQAESLEKTREAERFLQSLNLDLFPPIDLKVSESSDPKSYSMIIEGKLIIVTEDGDQVAMSIGGINVRGDIYAREIKSLIDAVK